RTTGLTLLAVKLRNLSAMLRKFASSRWSLIRYSLSASAPSGCSSHVSTADGGCQLIGWLVRSTLADRKRSRNCVICDRLAGLASLIPSTMTHRPPARIIFSTSETSSAFHGSLLMIAWVTPPSHSLASTNTQSWRDIDSKCRTKWVFPEPEG